MCIEKDEGELHKVLTLKKLVDIIVIKRCINEARYGVRCIRERMQYG